MLMDYGYYCSQPVGIYLFAAAAFLLALPGRWALAPFPTPTFAFLLRALNALRSPELTASPDLLNRFLPPNPNFSFFFWRLGLGPPLPSPPPRRPLAPPPAPGPPLLRALRS